MDVKYNWLIVINGHGELFYEDVKNRLLRADLGNLHITTHDPQVPSTTITRRIKECEAHPDCDIYLCFADDLEAVRSSIVSGKIKQYAIDHKFKDCHEAFTLLGHGDSYFTQDHTSFASALRTLCEYIVEDRESDFNANQEDVIWLQLESGKYIRLWWSDAEPYDAETAWGVLGYNSYDANHQMIDGGEIDITEPSTLTQLTSQALEVCDLVGDNIVSVVTDWNTVCDLDEKMYD